MATATKTKNKLAEWNAARERMKAGAQGFDDVSPDAIQRRRERAAVDKMYFLRTYLPHYCMTKTNPAFHEELFDLLDTKNTPVAITAMRGGAKSVIASLAEVLHRIYFDRIHFHIFVSDTVELATDFCRFVKIEIEENPFLRGDFGALAGASRWKEDDFVTGNGVRVLARAFKKRVRGLRHRQYRPDSVVLDDYENDDEQFNPRILEKKERWIKEVVIPALDPGGWMLAYVGTLLSSGCVLGRFMDTDKSPEWLTANFPALVDGHSFWPERFSDEYLAKIRRQIGEKAWNQEYMGVVTDEETAVFRRAWMKRVPLTQALLASCPLRVTYTDASAGSGESNDFKACITLGWDGSKYIVLHTFIKHCTTQAMADELFARKAAWGIACNGMEEVAFQSLFRDLFSIMAQQKGFALPTQFRKVTLNKEIRIRCLQALFENGMIEIAQSDELDAGDMDRLIEQLIYFPNTNVNDDAPDALEGAVWLAQQLGAGLYGINMDAMFAEDARAGCTMFNRERGAA